MLEILKKSPFFNFFPESALTELQNKLKIEHYSAGEEIFKEGSLGSCMYLISAGEVEISKKDRKLTRFKKGNMFGEMGLFGSERRSADARAVGDCSLIRINNSDFKDVLFKNPEPGCHFLFSAVGEISQRLRRTTSYLVAIYETGKIIGGDYPVGDMTHRILLRLIEEIKDATGGLILVYNPYTDLYDQAASENTVILNESRAAELIENSACGNVHETNASGVIFGCPSRGEEKTKGFIFIEKKDSRHPLSSNEEIITAAVANQLALGLLKSESKKDNEARKLLERKKMGNSEPFT